jgi:hypothetical protein
MSCATSSPPATWRAARRISWTSGPGHSLSCTPASKRSGISPGYQSSTTTAGARSAPPSACPGNHRAAGAYTGGCTLNSTAHVKCGELPGHVRCEDGSPEAPLRRLIAGPLWRRASSHRRGRLNPEPPQACAARHHWPAGVAALPRIGPDLPFCGLLVRLCSSRGLVLGDQVGGNPAACEPPCKHVVLGYALSCRKARAPVAAHAHPARPAPHPGWGETV